MAAFYFDSSALVKYYLDEVGSNWVESVVDAQPTNEILIAHVAGAEIVAAITRSVRMGITSPSDGVTAIQTFSNHFQSKYQIVIVSLAIVEQAMKLAEKYGLRGYDAIQLATALAVESEMTAIGVGPLTFVSADANLNQATIAEGLLVEDPNQHP
jgi:hypothetical protein